MLIRGPPSHKVVSTQLFFFFIPTARWQHVYLTFLINHYNYHNTYYSFHTYSTLSTHFTQKTYFLLSKNEYKNPTTVRTQDPAETCRIKVIQQQWSISIRRFTNHNLISLYFHPHLNHNPNPNC